jgi:hypothetical protein
MTKRSPFRYFKTSHEIIRLAVMLYIRLPLSVRNFEDLPHKRGIEISHKTVRYWWNRFGSLSSAEISGSACKRCRSSASVLPSVHSQYATERHLQDRNTYKQIRDAALAEWRGLLTA